MSTPEAPYQPEYHRHAQDRIDEIILADWRDGVRIIATAKRLGLAHSTISSRRKLIRVRSNREQTQPLAPPQERARRPLDMARILAATSGMAWTREE